MIELLIKKEGNIRGASASRWASQRVLHEAADHGGDAAALRLLKKGGDANVINEQDQTALHIVGRHCFIGVAQLLIKYWAGQTNLVGHYCKKQQIRYSRGLRNWCSYYCEIGQRLKPETQISEGHYKRLQKRDQ